MRNRSFAPLALASLALAGVAHALPASAAEIKVLTAGAIKPLVVAATPAFERETGHRLVVETATAGALVKRVRDGEAFEVVIVTAAGLAQLVEAGKVVADSATPIARVGIGAAVKAGAPAPDIATPAAFKQALLDARAVAHIDPAAGGSSGIYLVGLFARLGIDAEVARKAVLVPGGLTAQRLTSGEADLALQQLTELFELPGVTVLGPIPAELQNYTTYAGGAGTSARDAAAARAFLAVLAAPAARARVEGRGLQAP